MTATQRIALLEIADAGPLRLNDLAARIGTSAPTASRTVDTFWTSSASPRATADPGRPPGRSGSSSRPPAAASSTSARPAPPTAFEPAVRSAHRGPDHERLLDLLARMTSALLARQPALS